MTYLDQANLATDTEFQRRLAAAVAQEAKAKPEDDSFANSILRSPAQGAQMFVPFLASEPGFDTAFAGGGQASIVDGMILSAVQVNWDRVSELYFPTPVEEPPASS